MGRPKKKGLAYFPLDTDLFSDRKIQRLIKKYGCEGITTYIAILCETYATNGYYLEFNKNLCFDIGFTLNLGERKVENIIKFCTSVGLFDNKMKKNKNILTSLSIQQRYREIQKRGKYELDTSFLIVPKTGVNVTETPVSAAKTPTNGNGNYNKIKKEKTNVKKKSDDRLNQSTDHSAISRAAQLQQLLDAATTGNKHA